jgi:hypothetical protein
VIVTGRRIAVYYAWSRPDEIGAPLGVIENRFPALFEIRRMLYPHLQEFTDPSRFDQSVAGFLDHIMKANYTAFVALASGWTGQPVLELERVEDDGRQVLLDDDLVDSIDTLIVISFDSVRTGQQANDVELQAIRSFLAKPGNLLVVSPHHEVGTAEGLSGSELLRLQEADFRHHGDKMIPPQQRFGGFGRSLLAGLGVPVENRFGLHPAAEPDGSPSPIEIQNEADRLRLLEGVTTFNLHPHLPHLERLGDALEKMDVLARQRIDLAAPPHPFTRDGRSSFDALLQSRPGVFAGDLLVSDATLWSSTAGGLDSLRRFWANVAERERP